MARGIISTILLFLIRREESVIERMLEKDIAHWKQTSYIEVKFISKPVYCDKCLQEIRVRSDLVTATLF